MNRRKLLLGIGTLACMPFIHRSGDKSLPECSNEYTSKLQDLSLLKQLASEKGYSLGTAVSGYLFEDPRASEIVKTLCNTIVCEASMKQVHLAPEPGSFNFKRADQYLEYACKNQLDMRGHVAVWHKAQASWFDPHLRRKNKWQSYENYLTGIASHFAGKMKSWDVVNEVTSPNLAHSNGLRESNLLYHLGPEYIDVAFQLFNDIDPNAVLYINEYFWADGKRAGKKMDAFLSLLESLLRKGVPVGGVGIQAHIIGNISPPNNLYQRLIQFLNAENIELQITEMDFRHYGHINSCRDLDSKMVDQVRAFLFEIESSRTYQGMVMWGLTLKHRCFGCEF